MHILGYLYIIMGKIIKLFLNNFVVKGFVDNKSLSIFALAKSETQPWKCG